MGKKPVKAVRREKSEVLAYKWGERGWAKVLSRASELIIGVGARKQVFTVRALWMGGDADGFAPVTSNW